MITQNVTLSLSLDSLLRRRYPLKTPAWEAIQKVDQNFNPGLVQEPITYRHLISAYQPFRTLILPQPTGPEGHLSFNTRSHPSVGKLHAHS